MKKLSLILLACVIMAIVPGCSNNSELTSKIEQLESENSTLETENEKLKNENVKIQQELDEYKQKEAIIVAEEKKVQEEKNKYKQINIDDIVSVDGYGEFVIESCNLTQKVMPPNPDSFYNYYEVKDPNEIYLDVVMKFKNTSTIGLGADEVTSVKVIYGNGYEYNSFSTIEESGGGDFTYTNITKIEPLKSARLHYLATLPIEVKNSNESIKIQFSIYNNKYELQVR